MRVTELADHRRFYRYLYRPRPDRVPRWLRRLWAWC
jgi:hypothetical protein